MEDFLLLSNLYSQVNKALHHHGHDYDSSQLTFLVNQIKRCFISLSTKTMDKEFNNKCKAIADALDTTTNISVTASDIERIWQENDISSVMKKGSMIFTSFGEVELIVNRLVTINYNKAKYEEQLQLLYNCLDYNNKTIQHHIKHAKPEGEQLVLDPRAEYLLSRTTQIVRIVEGSYSDRISMAAQLQDIMNYPVAYIATNVMIEPPLKYDKANGKAELYKDICELYSIGMLAVRWLDDKDEDGNLLKPNAIAWLFTVTLATTVLPMRCRYASLDSTVLHHLNHITRYMQAYIDNTQKTDGLTAAIHHLQLLASDAGIDWSDVVARYAQTNLDHLNSQQQQEQEEEDNSEVVEEMERMNIHPAAMTVIEATAGKPSSQGRGNKKKKVKFGSGKRRS